MKVLVACERSGIVREAFRALGHDAYSCDIEPSDDDSPFHHQCEVESKLDMPWDLLIAHPPCTDIAVSGARWFPAKIADGRQQAALDFVRLLMNCTIERICVENPVSVISTHIRKPDQIIQPYEYGHHARKTTCLWLKNLPLLTPTDVVEPELVTYTRADGRTVTFSADYGVGYNTEHGTRRSVTYPGIGEAMALQWGGVV